MIKSTYIRHLGNIDIYKNEACWYYQNNMLLEEKIVLGGDSKKPMERKHGKQYIIFKWSHAKNWKPKGK